MEAIGGVRMAAEVTRKVEKTVESQVKKAWSVLDAASEKTRPSEQLSQKAVKAIQGQS